MFWSFFNSVAYDLLGERRESFKAIFRYLDQLQRPVLMIETGCVRVADNWGGDGQSTRLFDLYAKSKPGSRVYSVDIDPEATKVCRSLVSDVTTVVTGDSVSFLRGLARNPPNPFSYADLVYLDSFDLDKNHVHPSAMHHLKELVAVSSLITPDTLVVVDDAPSEAMFVLDAGEVRFQTEPVVSGKGKYVAEYAKHIGANLIFSGYQAGWTGF